jgi:hypothetical protein
MHVPSKREAEAADGLRYSAVFVPGLLDPGRETPGSVAGPNGKAADKGFNVYRNNVIVSLIDALAAAFPATMRITGETFFRAMARFHIRETPPTSPLLFEYGRDFPDFIERYEHAQAMPWLADVARIERAWLDAYHAADAAVLQPEELAAVPSERLGGLVFEPHPATRLVRSAYPAATIFLANRSSDLVGRIDATAPQSALVTRPALEVKVRHLPPGADGFLGWLMAGEPLGNAAAMAGACCADFDLTTTIRITLETGALAAIHYGG